MVAVGLQTDAYRGVVRIADALERIAEALERPTSHPQYQELMQVDADDETAVSAMQANPGWELLQTGTGRGGQPVLLFGFGREGS